MIFSEWIINNKGLLVHCDNSAGLAAMENAAEEIILRIFEKAQEGISEWPLPSEMVVKIQPKAKGQAYFINNETYVLIYKPGTSGKKLKERVKTLQRLRRDLKERLQGMVIGWMDDVEGPVPIFEFPKQPEGLSQMLVVQGTTIIGMGSIYPQGLFGPLPVPQSEELETLVYSFLIDAPDSMDRRIASSGRPSFIFLLFKKGDVLAHSATVHIFLNTYLNSILPQDFKKTTYTTLFANLSSIFMTAIDTDLAISQSRKQLIEAMVTQRKRIKELKEENEKLRRINEQLTTHHTQRKKWLFRKKKEQAEK